MIESIGWRGGWGFVVGSAAALAGLWYASARLQMGWAWWAYVAVAVVVSIAALVVVLDAWTQAGGRGEREFAAMSDIYPLVIDAPWWTKAVVILSGVAWVLV